MTGVISSMKDQRVADVRALASRAARDARRRCVLEGGLLVGQALRSGANLDFVLAEPGAAVLADTEAAGVAIFPASAAVLRHALRTKRPVDALAVAHLPVENDPTTGYGDVAVVLDDIVDPGNLGTIVRTACGLGATDIVCTDHDTDLSSRRVLDASRGAVLGVAVHRYPSPLDAVSGLRAAGFAVVASSPHGTPLRPLPSARIAVVLGNEANGVSQPVLAASDHVLAIPMAGDTDSLNVGVAAGLLLYELRRHRP